MTQTGITLDGQFLPSHHASETRKRVELFGFSRFDGGALAVAVHDQQ